MRQTWRLLWQTAVLTVIFKACSFLVEAADLPVPANVLGIVILFLLLFSGIIKEEYVSEAATFMLKHLPFFFVPIAVGLMDWGGVFYDYGLVLLIAILVSSLLPLLAVGWLAQMRKKDEKP